MRRTDGSTRSSMESSPSARHPAHGNRPRKPTARQHGSTAAKTATRHVDDLNTVTSPSPWSSPARAEPSAVHASRSPGASLLCALPLAELGDGVADDGGEALELRGEFTAFPGREV